MYHQTRTDPTAPASESVPPKKLSGPKSPALRAFLTQPLQTMGKDEDAALLSARDGDAIRAALAKGANLECKDTVRDAQLRPACAARPAAPGHDSRVAPSARRLVVRAETRHSQTQRIMARWSASARWWSWARSWRRRTPCVTPSCGPRVPPALQRWDTTHVLHPPRGAWWAERRHAARKRSVLWPGGVRPRAGGAGR
jgi:hypothetical protein